MMPESRHIEEGKGATLPIDDKIPAVGTWNLITCVGIYFRIDESRCFVAHMNTPSTVTWPENVVTDKEGKGIVSHVVQALDTRAKRDKWDVRNEYFGTDFLLQCPIFDDLWGSYKRAAHFAVQGVHERLPMK